MTGGYLVIHVAILPILVRRGRAVGDNISDVLQSTTSSMLTSSIVQVGTLPQFSEQWRSITLNRFVLNMVNSYHLQLRCPPLLFHNSKCFNIKTVIAHHPVTQKEVDELLVKDTTEPSTGGADF